MAMVRQSKKRDAMLTALRATARHPSAEQLYRQLKPDYPDLSRAPSSAIWASCASWAWCGGWAR